MKVIYRRSKYLFISLLLLFAILYGCTKQPSQYTSREHDQHVQITGCYSNLFQHEDTGDILGCEIFIVYSNDGYHVLYQESEGWPRTLLLLPASIDDDTVRFTIPYDNGNRPETFQGVVTADNLTGSFANGEEIVLPRKKSFWQ